MVDFDDAQDDMRKKAEEGDWDDKARDRGTAEFNNRFGGGDNPRQDEQGQRDLSSDTEEQ
jgi:hypothetical protein